MVVATLGQITDGGHLLLIPTSHSPCLGALDPEQALSFDRFVKKTVDILKLEYLSPVTLFEHGLVGQTVKHSHLHLLPAFLNLTDRLEDDFPQSEFQTISHFSELRTLYEARPQPYLLWSTPSSLYQVCWNPPAPAQYLRSVSAELLGVPERADWKNMDPELDQTLARETMERLVPHFMVSLFTK